MEIIVALVIGLTWIGVVRSEPFFQQADLFTAGLDGVNVYRIPSLLVTPNGVILAFCEAREGDDGSPTDLVLKRSVHAFPDLHVNGVMWSNDRKWLPMQVVLAGDGEAIMNPCPAIDQSDGTIWLCCIQVIGGFDKHVKGSAQYRTLILKSTDDGATWFDPMDISSSVGCFVPGPGIGVQLRSGRLVIPGYGKENPSKVIYSDDHGRTWHAGEPVAQHNSESQAVELTDGTLMLNMRHGRSRLVARSPDGGQSWSKAGTDEALIDSWGCQTGIIRYAAGGDAANKGMILFSNPAHESDRVNMTVRLSRDDGRSWPVGKTVHAGPSAYSCLAVLADGTIGLLYEGGKDHPYEKISFARFNLEWLTGGRDRAEDAERAGKPGKERKALMQPCLDYGRSFINTKATSNSPRFWIESRCLISDPSTGETAEYYQCGSCKSEHTFAEKDLFQEDNFDFLPIFSQRETVIFRRRSRWTGEYHEVAGAIWGGTVPSQRVFTGRVLTTPEEIFEAMSSGKPLVGQTELRDKASGRKAIIEYPIKTINWHRGNKVWQVDTGPVIFPDLSVPAAQWSRNIKLAFIAFRTEDWADFVVEQPTPIMDGEKEAAKVYHYSGIIHLDTRNVIIALDGD